MSDFARCKTCGDHDFLSRHTCRPEWECRLAWDDYPGADWHTVHAYDAETAAEKFADRYDSEGDHTIICGRHRHNDVIVYVRKPADPDSFDVLDAELFAIEAEAVPHYYGTKLNKRAAA